MRHALVAAMALALAGCGTGPVDYTKLPKAPAGAMVPPKKMDVPRKGDDLDEKHIDLFKQYQIETGKVRVLQARERTLQGR